jgi:His/Glu/Gln/Arg/opine family amino acid ABC transporter permease subunit
MMDWRPFLEHADVLWAGLLLTLKLMVLGIIGSFVVGVTIGALGSSSRFLLRRICSTYVEVMRNVPLVVKLFFLYFILGLDSFPAALLALIIHQSGFISDVTQAGLRSIPHEQAEAASTTGLTTPQTFLYVMLPQLLRVTIPPFTNQAIELLKNTALVSLIGLQDLTFVAQNIQIETYRYRESFIAVTALYVTLAFAIVGVMSALQKRLSAR